MQAVRCQTFEEFEAAGSGSFLITGPTTPEDAGRMLWYRCPCCTRTGALALRPTVPAEYRPSWQWDGNELAPTLDPSIFSQKEKGGCGWHGYLKAGVWETC